MTRPRSIFMRKGLLLTTLAAAVLLAASAGTALAQSPRIGFTPRSGSVNEGATADADSEHPLLTVTVRARGLPAGPAGQGAGGQPTARQQAIDALGEITIETEGIGRREAATISPLYDTPAALDEDVVFAASDTFQLTVDPVQDDDSLNDEFSLRLRSTESINTGARYRGTVIDDDPLATATFSRTDIKVFEEETRGAASASASQPRRGESFPDAGRRTRTCRPDGHASCRRDRRCRMPHGGANPDFALRIWSETETLSFGSGCGVRITIEKSIANYQRGPTDLRLTACGDMSDYRDSTVTLAFQDSSLQTPAGRIAAGPPAIIQILNDDPLAERLPVDPRAHHRRGQDRDRSHHRAGRSGQCGDAGTRASHRRRPAIAVAGRRQIVGRAAAAPTPSTSAAMRARY